MFSARRLFQQSLCGRDLRLVCAFLILASTAWPTTILAGTTPGDFPGGTQPGPEPALFAPGLINTGLLTRDVTMTPDGKELYFCQATAGYRQAVILVTRKTGSGWSEPEVAEFSGSGEWVDLEPFISPDGKKFFFYSSRPALPGGEPAQDIWVMDRVGDQWGEPRNLGAPINTDAPEFFPAVTADGTVYFSRADPQTRVHSLFRSRLVDGQYQEPELLPAEANSGRNRFNAWVAPDQSRMIVPVVGHPENLGGVDYWLVARGSDDAWTGPFNLGAAINDGSGGSWSPYVSPDGQTFFFMSGRQAGPAGPWPESWSGLQNRHLRPGSGRSNIFWMQAEFLDEVAAGREPLRAPPGERTSETFHSTRPKWPSPTGPYLGCPEPGLIPEVFAPGLISTGLNERDIVISPDGAAIYFGLMDLSLVTVMVTRQVDGRWTEPVTAGFHLNSEFACFEPTLGENGDLVLFLANQAAPGQEQGTGWANQNIFLSRRDGSTWSVPQALPGPVTTAAAEYFPSLAADGTLYFSREDEQGHPYLWMAEPEGQGFGEPARLPDPVNVGTSCYNCFVAPDESFLIACVAGHPENLGPADYWMSTRGQDGKWGPARNLGERFNGPDSRASSAFLSPDGKFLFFSSSRVLDSASGRLTRAELNRLHGAPGNGASDIWWVSARVLDPFRE
jgi:hypothetical protein